MPCLCSIIAYGVRLIVSCLVVMRRLTLAAITVGAVLSACLPVDVAGTSTPAPTATMLATDPRDFDTDGIVGFNRSGLSVELQRPKGWESFTTDYGVVIAEKFPSVADHGQLQGLMAYVFVTPLAEFPFVIDEDPALNSALQVLAGIAADASASGSAHVTRAEGFEWAGYDAAYYLLSEPNSGLRTLVIGLSLPETGVILTCAVSAPHQSAARIRAMLPLLLGGLMLNTQTIGADDLQGLPETLDFPE